VLCGTAFRLRAAIGAEGLHSNVKPHSRRDNFARGSAVGPEGTFVGGLVGFGADQLSGTSDAIGSGVADAIDYVGSGQSGRDFQDLIRSYVDLFIPDEVKYPDTSTPSAPSP
jgi:hypothetical protein